jgi:hypothetical protein
MSGISTKVLNQKFHCWIKKIYSRFQQLIKNNSKQYLVSIMTYSMNNIPTICWKHLRGYLGKVSTYKKINIKVMQ